MVGLPPGKSAAVPRTALCLGNKLVTGRTSREGGFRRIAARRAPWCGRIHQTLPCSGARNGL